MDKKKNPLFIHAISQRCGHNFLAKIIQSQTDYKVLIHNAHEVIVPELLAKKMKDLCESSKFIRNKKAKINEIEEIARAYIYQKEDMIFKTSRLTSHFEIDLFPDVKHIILIRNPKDLFVSYEKSIYDFRVSSLKNRIKKFLRPIYSYYVLKAWSKSISQAINAFSSAKSKYLLVRYEDLLTVEGQKQIFNYLDHPIDIETTIEVDNINSSFAEKSKRWKVASKNVGNTTKRYENAPFWLKLIIDLTLQKQNNAINY